VHMYKKYFYVCALLILIFLFVKKIPPLMGYCNESVLCYYLDNMYKISGRRRRVDREYNGKKVVPKKD